MNQSFESMHGAKQGNTSMAMGGIIHESARI
jgi:hypothetical protein